MTEPLQEPLSNEEAKRLVREIIEKGVVDFTEHANGRMEDNSLTTVDVVNVLRGGWVDFHEQERGTWRYRICTQRISVVIVFRSATRFAVVTAFRN